ncbi:formylglycine-generating enzyme family protein [Candidatus Poribacteria bacterium]|nr:formylglycine-generating enzyme family protein [Candidatus Poribacteria bacterium]
MRQSKISILILLSTIIIVAGCGEDDPIEFLSVNPSDGSTITTDSIITIKFSGTPNNLNISTGNVTKNGDSVSISGPFEIGELTIDIEWEEGNHSLTYKVEKPDLGIPEGMVLIPEGKFKMGSLSGDDGIVEEIGTSISLDAFYIDQYEVTNQDFKEFIQANSDWSKDNIASNLHDGNYLTNWNGDNFPDGKADHPVVYVNWYAAVAYALWLDKRLPTEAEWEKAARGGIEGRKYPWGNSIDESQANYSLNVGITGNTTPVGEYPPNEFMIYDMVGNVLEWCIDRYDRNYFDEVSDSNPIGGNDTIKEIKIEYRRITSSRSIRGGSWVESGQPRVSIIYRRGNEPARTSHLIGFRCAKSISQ